MLMGEDVKPVIELILENADLDIKEVIQLFFDAIERECNGGEASSLDVYETLLNSIVRKVKEDR